MSHGGGVIDIKTLSIIYSVALGQNTWNLYLQPYRNPTRNPGFYQPYDIYTMGRFPQKQLDEIF
jgi:hypothetical protein